MSRLLWPALRVLFAVKRERDIDCTAVGEKIRFTNYRKIRKSEKRKSGKFKVVLWLKAEGFRNKKKKVGSKTMLRDDQFRYLKLTYRIVRMSRCVPLTKISTF